MVQGLLLLTVLLLRLGLRVFSKLGWAYWFGSYSAHGQFCFSYGGKLFVAGQGVFAALYIIFPPSKPQ